LASAIVAGTALVISVGIAWIAIDRSAELLEQHREKMIDVIARSADV
jgi:hypothetical protein